MRLHAGVPTVVDTTQRVGPTGGADTALLGRPMVADRVRAVAPRSVDYGLILLPEVGLYTRSITVPSFTGGLGVPYVEEHKNILAVKGGEFTAFGEGRVWNVTPEVIAAQWLSNEFGRPAVDLYTRYVETEGFGAAIFGSPVTDFRTRTVRPGGVETLRVGKQEVAHDAPQIPPSQLVQPIGLPALDQFGTPDLLYRGALVSSWISSRFGTANVRTNVVSNVTIPLNEVNQMGEPSLNTPQFIEVKGMVAPALAMPRLSPMTIWIHEPPAPWEPLPLSLVDELYSSQYPTFGEASVDQRNRTLVHQHTGGDSSAVTLFGDPEVSLRVRHVAPSGIAPRRFGFPRLPAGGGVMPYWGRFTEEWIEGNDFDTAEYGVPEVSFPPVSTRMLGMFGADQSEMGVTDVSLWVRTLEPVGIYSTIFTGDNSVHPPVRLLPAGIPPGDAGTLWSSLKIRSVYPVGTDMLRLDYAIGSGSFFPLKVRHRNYMAPTSIGPLVPSAPVVTLPDLGAVVSLGDTSRFGRPRIGACSC